MEGMAPRDWTVLAAADGRRARGKFVRQTGNPRSANPSTRPNQAAILIIDDDPGLSETARWALRPERIDVQTVSSGVEGLATAHSRVFDLVLVDLRLPDMPGTEVLRVLRDELKDVPLILISGFLTTPVIVEAMKLGATDVLEKPIAVDALVEIARSAIRRQGKFATAIVFRDRATPKTESSLGLRITGVPMRPRSAAERWALHVLRALQSEGDLKTLQDWATFVGVSYSSLCESCRLTRIRPHDARDLVRTLRVLIRARVEHCHPQALLDISDRRTLRGLLERAGLDLEVPSDSVTLEQFLERQRFIGPDNEGLNALRLFLLSAKLSWPPVRHD